MATLITYVKGDVRTPSGNGRKIIVHCCNDIGAMGAGVAAALFHKWPSVKSEYKQWHRSKKGFELGAVQFVKVDTDIVVGNMIGQKGIKTVGGVPPIRYGAIRKCLERVAEAAVRNNASVHGPKFGAGLAGGSWDEIERLIEETICARDIEVTIYEL